MSDNNNAAVEAKALPIPKEVFDAQPDHVAELMRVWWAGEKPQMMIRPAAHDPMLIGIILSELAWHFSNAYAAGPGMDRQYAFDRIMAGWTDGHRMRDKTPAGAAE